MRKPERHRSRSSRSSGLIPLGLAAALLPGCTGEPSPEPGRAAAASEKTRPGEKPGEPSPGEDSHFLDEQQRALLRKLRDGSGGDFSVDVSERAGTVRRLEVRLPPSGGDPVQVAEDFVRSYGALWHLNKGNKLVLVEEHRGGDCSRVTFQLVHSSGLPVWNARLSIFMGEDGGIRGASGTLSGDKLALSDDKGLPPGAARELLAADRAKRDLDPIDAPPTEVIFDPFFFGDEDHAAQRAWLFSSVSSSAGAKDEAPAYSAVVGATTKTVVVDGPLFVPDGIDGCTGDPAGLPLKVALDPLTDVPALVDLTPLGGLVAPGQDPAARAVALLAREPLARLFGDVVPSAHLTNPRVTAGPGGRTVVTFDEQSNGRRVEGASMQVMFGQRGHAERIFARYVYRPEVALSRNVSLGGARVIGDATAVTAACGTDKACAKALRIRLASVPPAAEEVILSSRIFPTAAIKAKSEVLAWRLAYDQHVVYVNAWAPNEQVGAPLLIVPRRVDAIPHDIHDLSNNDRLEIQDFVELVSAPNPQSRQLASEIATMDAFFLGLGRNGFDGSGTRMAMRVGWGVANAMFCPAPCTGMPEPGLYFGTIFGTDVTGHEFTHAVTDATSGLVYTGESGALNESYSDLFGNLIFPDSAGGWLVGEDSSMGPIRDMATPGNFGSPGHVAFMDPWCLPADGCVHVWSGVPNRVAVLLSDGGVPGDPHPGLGRPTLASLALTTLVSMGPSDQFVNQQVRTVATCRMLVGQQFGGRTLMPADCDFVTRAFAHAGIDAQHLYGWQRFSTGLFGNRWDYEAHAGERLHNGCVLADTLIWGEDPSGVQRTAGAGQGREINFGEWGARISFRAADADPADRHVGYHLWSNWFQTGVARPIEAVIFPPNITREQDCWYPLPPNTPPDPAKHVRRLFATTRVSHWATFFNGGRGDDPVNTGVVMPAGCEVAAVSMVHDHRLELQPGTYTQVNHGSHGASIARKAFGPAELDVEVHWWHDGLSSIGVRPVYDVLEPDGTDCSVPGATQDLP